MLVLSRGDIERLLDPGRLVDALAGAMADLTAGRASMPARVAAVVPDRHGVLAAMPAHVPGLGALTTKLVSVFPENTSEPTHQAVICAFDPATGRPLALLDGTYITAARTAAGSVLATRLLARPDATVAAVVGTGVQARSHIRAFDVEGRIERFVVAGRDAGRARSLAAEMAAETTATVEAVASIEVAVRRADVVCATTHAASPVVRRSWLAPGVHVNSVGYNIDGEGEVDAETVRDALVVVESRAAALAPPPAGAVELQGPEATVHAEIGELVAGTATGRTDAEQVTLYKSVGVAVQDAAATAIVLEAARAAGAGRRVDL